MNKRILSCLTAAALVLSLAACSSSETAETTAEETLAPPEAGATYTGTVAEISETSITISTEDGDYAIPLSDSTVFTYGGGDAMGEVPEGMGEAPDDMGEIPDGTGEAPDDMGEAPDDMGEIPDGTGEAPDGAGEAPEGMGDAPDGMGGGMADLTWESVAVGDTVTVTVDEDGNAATVTVPMADMGGMEGMGGGMNAPGGTGGMSSGVDSYDAATEYTTDATVSDADFDSTGTDENAILVSGGADVTLKNVAITRISADSTGGDNSSFYGVGAAALVTEGTLTIEDSVIESDAAGGAGVFAYGDGVAYVSDTTITTAQDTSGGIHVAGGGTLYAWNLTVDTSGESSAAIRSDRGSGTMVVDGGSYTSHGTGSPAVYSTADITVNGATLTATGSEAICIEGLNTIRLFDCDLSGNMSDSSQNDCTWNVILYQSMSGDSEVGNSTFEMIGGTLTAGNGGMFYTTNTESTFVLSGVEITYAEENDFFLKCTGNSNQRGWGSTGSNGADCTFTAIAQAMEGDIIWDSISQLDFYMLDGSTLVGAFIDDESNVGSGGSGYASLYIDATSSWIVTGDSYLTNLYCEGTIVDETGATVTICGTDGTVYVQGTSSYTITVESYSDSADLSGASTASIWADYEVTK